MKNTNLRTRRLPGIGTTADLVRAALAAFLASAVAVSAAHAETAKLPGPSAEEGQALANRLCATCHLVGPNARQPTTVLPGIPSFPAIANRPEQTGNNISLTMINPHPPMTDPVLTRAEILHLLAYLESLRTIDDKKFLPEPTTPTRKPPPTERPS